MSLFRARSRPPAGVIPCRTSRRERGQHGPDGTWRTNDRHAGYCPTHAAVPPESVLGRLTRFFDREHRALVILIIAASVVRLMIMVAYRPALWYHGDSGSYILLAQNTLRPQATFAVGYSAFLKILSPREP